MNNQNFSEVFGKALNNVLLVYRFFHSSYLFIFFISYSILQSQVISLPMIRLRKQFEKMSKAVIMLRHKLMLSVFNPSNS